MIGQPTLLKLVMKNRTRTRNAGGRGIRDSGTFGHTQEDRACTTREGARLRGAWGRQTVHNHSDVVARVVHEFPFIVDDHRGSFGRSICEPFGRAPSAGVAGVRESGPCAAYFVRQRLKLRT